MIENVFNKKQCDTLKKRAFYLVNKDKSKKVTGFSLKKNNHHSSDNFISSAYKINSFYEDSMINKDGTFKDKKINCISKLGHCLHDLDKVFKKYSYYYKIKKLMKLVNLNNPILNQSSYIFKQPFIGGEYLWHQDSTYLLTNPLSCVAFWVAIDNANKKNGCLIVKPGSHKEKIRKRVSLLKGKIIKKNLIKDEWNEKNNFPLFGICLGHQIIALANATRCCSPPLNSCGYFGKELGSFISFIISSISILASDFPFIANFKFSLTLR